MEYLRKKNKATKASKNRLPEAIISQTIYNLTKMIFVALYFNLIHGIVFRSTLFRCTVFCFILMFKPC